MINTLFGINYEIGILIGILVVVPYVFIGGYLTLAWLDLFQGLFLMGVILFVPLYLLPQIGGFQGIQEAISTKQLVCAFLPDCSPPTLWKIFLMLGGFGLGYFGQPHIVTKFMGIKHVEEISKSKLVGMSWMVVAQLQLQHL